jgi:hypothetical protein
MDDRESLVQLLTVSRAVLQVFEQQAAGYTSLTIPANLKVQLDEKRTEVASLENRLAQLDKHPPASLPDNLPPPHAIFVGRKEEMRRCLEALLPEERGWGVVIDGIGGIGKTALALEVAHQARKQAWFDAYLFASAKTTWLTTDGVRQETLAHSSLDAFLREFAYRLSEHSTLQKTDMMERWRMLLDVLRGRRTLLIWDNLETLPADDRTMIAEFLRKLPSPNKAIITSRRRTGESAVTMRLDRLSRQEAFDLMTEMGERNPHVAAELMRANTATRHSLYDAVGGNPLALHWTLGLVTQKGYTLAQAVEQLRDGTRSQDLYSFLFTNAVRTLIRSDRSVLSALSAFYTPATLEALTEATSLSSNAVQMALERLLNLSLVNEFEGGGFTLHPLTRAYIRSVLQKKNTTQQAAQAGVMLDKVAYRQALQYWVQYACTYGGENYQNFVFLEQVTPDLEATATALRDIAGLPGVLKDKEAAALLNELAGALGTFLWFQGYWDEQINLSTWAYEAAWRLHQWEWASWRAYEINVVYWNRLDAENSRLWNDLLVQAMERGLEARDQISALYIRGLIAQKQDNLIQAEHYFMQALACCNEVDHNENEAMILNGLAEIARKRREYGKAEKLYREALVIAEDSENREGQAVYSANLGTLALNCHQLMESQTWYQQALGLALEVGRQDLIARVQAGMARVLEKLDHYEEALSFAEQSLQIRERLQYHRLEETRQLVQRLRGKL